MRAALLCVCLPAVLLAQEDLGTLLGRAREARDAGRLEPALAAYDAMLAQVPDHETALLERAQVLSWMGRYDEALGGYRRFRERFPQRAEVADLRIAQVLAWAGRYAESLETLAPWEARGLRQAVLDGATYRAWRGDLHASLIQLDGWIAAHPEDRDALLLRARFRSWTGDLRAAHREHVALLARFPGDAEARIGLGRVRLWEGDPRGAHAELACLTGDQRAKPEAQVLAAQVDLAEGRARQARSRLVPLAQGGAERKEARQLLAEAAEAQGPWVELRGTQLNTNEGLRMDDPALRLRMPLWDGHGDAALLHRAVDLNGDRRQATEVSVALAHPLGPWLRASGSLTQVSDLGGAAATEWSAGLKARLWPGLNLGLSAAHSLLAYTPTAWDHRESLHGVDLSLGWQLPDQRTRLDLGLGQGWLSAGTTRESWLATLGHRLPFTWGELRGSLLARGFGYSETLPLGFFNPERYRYGGATAGAVYRRGREVSVDLSLRGGWQVVNEDPTQFAWGYGLVLNWNPQAGRATFFASWNESVAGLPVVDPLDPSTYREHTLGLGARVRLGRY